jgi:ADP-heptose:LPS heptosyltransferase
MRTKFVGSGGLGDSVVLSTKLMNIVRYMPPGHRVHYSHFEAEKRAQYKKPLEEYWELVRRALQDYGACLNYQVINYPNGKFWEIVPKHVWNLSTALTTQVDNLCLETPPWIVSPIQSDSVALVADGGNGTRGFTDRCLVELIDYFKKVVILGKKDASKLTISTDSSIEDLRGRTTLTEALQRALGAKLVIAPDGILGYAAFIYNVPNLIVFHEPQLINAYWSKDMKRRSVACYSGCKINDSREIIDELAKMPQKV